MRRKIILGLSLLALLATMTGTAFASNTTRFAQARIVPVVAGADAPPPKSWPLTLVQDPSSTG